MKNTTKARSNIYALLSRILIHELDTGLLDTFKKDKAMLEFFPNFKEWEMLHETPTETLLHEVLNPDYTNLVILHLIPYETFYRRDDQMIETGGANPVTDMYSRYGYVVDFEKARVVSPDHIGVELEFMHYLCDAQDKAEQAEDFDAVEHLKKVQKEFIQEHLITWAPMYLINMKFESRTPFYFDAADMALEFIFSDNETLSEV